jgi:hypothetical protein
MYASQHCVFVGPGRVPEELRTVLLVRQGAPQPDLAIHVPRLLSFFDTAVDAERIAGQLQRLRLKTLMAGPEQPPAEDAWLLATSLEGEGDRWVVGLGAGGDRALDLETLSSLAVVEWRPPGTADRAVLVRAPGLERPLFLHARRLATPAAPFEGLRRLNALLDACEDHPGTRGLLRRRRLTPEELGAPTLSGDLLPLALAVVDAVDSPRHVPELG